MKMLKRICKNPDCQAEFETTHHARMYCCHKCANTFSYKKQNELVKARKKEAINGKNKSVISITVMARQHGMSYGQYVAKFGV